MSTTDDLLTQVNEELDKILGALLVSNKDTDTQIRILRSLGYDWTFVGAATGLSPDAARIEEERQETCDEETSKEVIRLWRGFGVRTKSSTIMSSP